MGRDRLVRTLAVCARTTIALCGLGATALQAQVTRIPKDPRVIPFDILIDRSALLAIPIRAFEPDGPFLPEWVNIRVWSDLTEAVNIGDLDSDHDVITLAAALRATREQDPVYRWRARNLIAEVATFDWQFTEPPTVDHLFIDELPVARNILSYVLAADLIQLDRLEPAAEASFQTFLRKVQAQEWSHGRTLQKTHELRPNNEGLVAGASRIAIDMYLNTARSHADLRAAKNVFRAWLGAQGLHSGFVFGADLSWHVDAFFPRGINPDGIKNGFNIGGALPDDMRRTFDPVDPGDPDCCPSVGDTFPACYGVRTNYVWEALQGAVMQAHLLARCGYPAFSWRTNALDRAMNWLYTGYGFPPEISIDGSTCQTSTSLSDDTWVPFITDAYYGTQRALTLGGKPGKNCGFADWWAQGIDAAGVRHGEPAPASAPQANPSQLPPW